MPNSLSILIEALKLYEERMQHRVATPRYAAYHVALSLRHRVSDTAYAGERLSEDDAKAISRLPDAFDTPGLLMAVDACRASGNRAIALTVGAMARVFGQQIHELMLTPDSPAFFHRLEQARDLAADFAKAIEVERAAMLEAV